MSAFGYTALATNREAKLFCRNRIDIDPTPAPIEPNVAVDESKNRIIAAKADVFPWQKLGPALADDDIAGEDRFASESFYTEAFADAVAPIFNAALSFFVSHCEKFLVDG
jgi:hypothetical protein